MRPLVLFLVVCVLVWPADAQQRQGARPVAPPVKEEPTPEPPPLAYEADLLRLSEVLGTLSYMDTLCKISDADSWRQRMTQLLESEGTTQQRKERLAGAFNRGFIGHQLTYRACTDSARQVVDRLVLQGQQIAREISSRYGG